ncbi:hypothetical protein [Citrobacter portucalensis]|uniref:hypothetical protein n=1 Tax=Citrobacter portucalensis TaxID=1639133 RepID=UPI001A2B9544
MHTYLVTSSKPGVLYSKVGREEIVNHLDKCSDKHGFYTCLHVKNNGSVYGVLLPHDDIIDIDLIRHGIGVTGINPLYGDSANRPENKVRITI